MADGIAGDAYLHRATLKGVGRTKERLAAATRQATSGDKYEKPRELGEKIVFVNRVRDGIKTQKDFVEHNSSFVKLKLGEQERAVRHLQQIAEDFKVSIASFNNGITKDPGAFISTVKAKLAEVEKEGNSRVGDSYIFAGTITNQPPFDLSLIADGIPETTGYTDAYYLGNGIKTPVAIDERQNLDIDIVGTYSGIEKLIRSMKMVVDPSIQGSDSKMNTAQNLVDEAIDELISLVSEIGSKDARMDDVIEAQEDRLLYFREKYDEMVKSEDEELAMQFLEDQKALSMAYEMIRHFNNMSLVDFIK